MPFTGNPTPHYNFGQYLGTDKSAWTDNNAQWATADTAIFGVEQKAESGIQTATTAQGVAQQANSAAVAAGNKADSLASQIANFTLWTSGNFTNPNASLLTSYDIKYKFNPTLKLLQITGRIEWNVSNAIQGDSVILRVSEIPGFILPISSQYDINNAGTMRLNYLTGGEHASRDLVLRMASNGACNFPNANVTYTYGSVAYIYVFMTTDGFGSSI